MDALALQSCAAKGSSLRAPPPTAEQLGRRILYSRQSASAMKCTLGFASFAPEDLA